jgi:hypothetical protein
LLFSSLAETSIDFVGFKLSTTSNEKDKMMAYVTTTLKMQHKADNIITANVKVDGVFERLFTNASYIFENDSINRIQGYQIETTLSLMFEVLGKTRKIEIKGDFLSLLIHSKRTVSTNSFCQNGITLSGTLKVKFMSDLDDDLKAMFTFDTSSVIQIKIHHSGHSTKHESTSIGSQAIQNLNQVVINLNSYSQTLRNQKNFELATILERLASGITKFTGSFTSATLSENSKHVIQLTSQSIAAHRIYSASTVKPRFSEFQNTYENLLNSLEEYSIVFVNDTGAIDDLQLESLGNICTSPGECAATGTIKLLSGFSYEKCSVADILVAPKTSRSSAIVFELPEDHLAAWTFSVMKGEKIQLTLPEKGHDDQYFTFNGRWKVYNTSINMSSVSVRFGHEFEIKGRVLDLLEDKATFDMEYHEGSGNLEVTGRFDTTSNGQLSQHISQEFYKLVQSRKLLFESKETVREESLSVTEDILRRQEASYERESLNLKNIDKQIVNITNLLRKQAGIVQNAKQKVQQSLSALSTPVDFLANCVSGPNYCHGHCLSSMNVVECAPDKKRVIFSLEYSCRNQPVTRSRVKLETPTKRNIFFIDSEMKVECFNECPPLVEQAQRVFLLSRDFDQFGHCYRFCREMPVPVQRVKEVIENQRESETYNQTSSKCSNNFRQGESQPGKPYEQERILCFKLQLCAHDIAQNCAAKVADCSHRVKSMSSADSSFKVAFELYTKEVNRQDVLNIQKQVLDASLKWQTNLKVFLNEIIQETREQISEITQMTVGSWENEKLSKYSTPNSIQLTEISFNYKFTKGSAPPNYVPLKIRSKDPQGDVRVPVVVLANVYKADQSVYDAAKALLEEGESTSTCFEVELSAVYLTNFVINVEKLVTDYQRNELQYNNNVKQLKESNMQLLQQAINHQKLSGGETPAEVENVKKLLDNHLIPPYRQWNETFITFLTKLRSESRNEDLCLSFDHCTEFHVKRIQDTLRFKDNSTDLVKIISNYNKLQKIFPRFLHANLTLSEVKAMAKDVYNKILSPDPVAMFCGSEPRIENQLNGDIKVKEGEILKLSVKIKNEEFDYTISWTRDQEFLPGYRQTTFQKIATVKDEGWYSCVIRNRFGVTDCGVMKVQVILKPMFYPPHHAVTVYNKSPRNLQYLVCNASNSEDVEWFHHSFGHSSQITRLSEKQFWLHVSQNLALQSGLYWCKVRNDILNADNQKARFHRDAVEMAIDQMEISFLFRVNLNARRRRDNQQRQKRQIPSSISASDMDKLQFMLSTIMVVNEKDIKNLKYTKEDPAARVQFTLEGKDFNKQLSDSLNWDELTEDLIGARKELLSQVALLDSKKSSITLQLENEQNLELVPGSIEISESKMKCTTEGYGLTDTGIVCGKFYLLYVYKSPEKIACIFKINL